MYDMDEMPVKSTDDFYTYKSGDFDDTWQADTLPEGFLQNDEYDLWVNFDENE
jgi:hypothetical protein